MTIAATGIEFLDLYRDMLAHQKQYDGLFIRPILGEPEQPNWYCMGCLRENRLKGEDPMRAIRRRYSFAIPSPEALDAIAEHSPGGVVELGAGGGYWAMLLQQRGVDVIAYDPDPPGIGKMHHWEDRPGGHRVLVMDRDLPQWHSGKAWTAVHQGDHRKAAEHPTRTLLLCWPSYAEPWAAQALEAFTGDTVVYIGEGPGGCTADDRFHALLGEEHYCSHWNDDYTEELPCPDDCAAKTAPLFGQIAEVAIPQWSGLHDYLRVYRRGRGG